MKKILSFLLAFFMLTGMFAAFPLLANAATEGDFNYTVTDGKATITSLTNTYFSGDLTVPTTLGSYPVTAIGANAFKSCTRLTSVTIPAGVLSIGDLAFWGCTRLTSISVNSGNPAYTSADGVLFNKEKTVLIAYPAAKSDTSYTIPTGVTLIKDSAFQFASLLTSITVPSGVTTIENNAFKYTSALVSITLPKSLTFIGESVFSTSLNLTKVYYKGTEEEWDQIEICSDNQYLTDATILYLAEAYIAQGKCGGNLSWALDADGILTISGSGDMTSFTSTVGKWSVVKGDVTTIIIGQGVTSIANSAFSGCTNLTSVTIANTVTSIGNMAFFALPNLTSVTIPGSVTTIGSDAFISCHGLTSVTIPASVTSIGEDAFGNCDGLTSISVAEGNEDYSSIDGVLFNKSETTLICYPAGKGTAYTIPSGVTSIGTYAFGGCNQLTSITIPNGLTSIGDYAFVDCTGLTSIILPDSITSIGVGAFYADFGLTTIYYTGTQEEWTQIEIDSDNSVIDSATIYYNYGIPAVGGTISGSSLTISPSNIPNGTRILYALYRGDQMVGFDTFLCDGTERTVPIPVSYDYIKIFAWNNLAPVTTPEPIS